MAVPKRRVSHTKTAKRKAVWLGALSTPSLSVCPHCGEMAMNYCACPECGYYRGRKVLKNVEEL
jgi:large subunit ribosomal protein L32